MGQAAQTSLLAIDQGTTSSRAILFDLDFQVLARAQAEFPQHFPAPGLVEHDPEDLWQSTLATMHQVLAKADSLPAAIGITNQRETTLLWDRRTGQALHPAIVWQDRRTAPLCEALKAAGHEPMIRERTGLLLDPYFSGTKLAWLLETLPDARARAERGELAFGTVDSWLIWKLTGGQVHATDATNAARTLLFDIRKGQWDPQICALLGIPAALLPQVRNSADDFGLTDPALFGAALPIRGVAGDQQAATIGQACFAPGMVKATYGTGCFALLNTGDEMVLSEHRLLTTIAYQLNGHRTYALEGSIFIAGAVVQWLRDGLGIIATAAETQELALAADPAQAVVVVPAFTGFGAPYWRADSRGAAFGLTRATGRAELARAALESIGFQTRDLWEAMRAAWPGEAAVLRVDGGMANSDWTMQFLADMLHAPVDRPHVTETTALGAAWLAGHAMGLVPGPAEFAASWALERRFVPRMDPELRAQSYARWSRAVAATLSF